MSDVWHSAGMNEENNPIINGTGIGDQASVFFTQTLNTWSALDPILVDESGTMYFRTAYYDPTTTEYFYCVQAVSSGGVLLWTLNQDFPISFYNGGKLYLVQGTKSLITITASTGAYTTTTPAALSSYTGYFTLMQIDDQGVFYFLAAEYPYEDERIVALNPDFSLKWTSAIMNTVGNSDGPCSVMVSGDYVYVGLFMIENASSCPIVACLNRATGVTLWAYSITLPGGEHVLHDSVVVSCPNGNAIVFVDAGGNGLYLYCINSSGTLVWSYTSGAVTISIFSNICVGSDNSVYFFINSHLIKLSSSGSVVWNISINLGMNAEMAKIILDQDNIYLAASTGQAYNAPVAVAISTSGGIVWEYSPTTAYANSLVTVAFDGNFYAGYSVTAPSIPFKIYKLGNAVQCKATQVLIDARSGQPIHL